jgi:hypothetical protein
MISPRMVRTGVVHTRDVPAATRHAGEAGVVDDVLHMVVWVVVDTEPSTLVAQGGRGVEKPCRDDRDDL